MKKISTKFYNVSRVINRVASVMNDVETIATGNPKKIIKRAKKKAVGKTLNKISRNILNKL